MINFTPVPTLDLGFYKISTHGLLIAAGFLIAELLARREAKRRGLSADIVDNAAIVAVLAGLVGARLIYILALGRGMSFLDMIEVWKGGLSSHGGYIFGIIAGLLYFKFKKVDILKYADAVIPYMLIGWAIGRVGCFLNWDSYGKITNVAWAVVVNGESRHPTQLYESFGYIIAFFLIHPKKSRPHFFGIQRPGTEAAASLALFAFVRFVVDFWRDDPTSYLMMSRLITVAIVILCVSYIFWPLKTKKVVV
jgi:phosphatidylglycerol:prolipoprotein diacylglycerol transferase